MPAAGVSGMGQPVLQGTVAPTANIELAARRLVLTAHAPSRPRPLPSPQRPPAQSAPPAATRPSEMLKATAVISLCAPRPLT